VSIERESDEYLKVGGLLYTFISLKEPPDSAYPGMLRELLSLEFPMVINTEIAVPDQAKVISQYKWRQRKMMVKTFHYCSNTPCAKMEGVHR
jgi:hypothetical protein